jgi:type II secretory ATPase GspE/PulE/Tfp pilus assembly ATPase PilB-like protein
MTGHQVFSTLHSNSALGAIPRLLDIGVLPEIVAGNVIGIVAQRLVRKLCPHCRKHYTPGPEELRILGADPHAPAPTLYRPAGCQACDYQGYRGRLAILEILRMDDELDELVLRHATQREMRQAAAAMNFRTLADDGIQRVLAGITSLDEVKRVIDLTGRM